MSIKLTLPLRAAGTICAAGLALGIAPVSATTITGWNTDNVSVGTTPEDGDTGASVVYDSVLPDAGAVTNGQILFTPPEAVSPGVKVVQES